MFLLAGCVTHKESGPKLAEIFDTEPPVFLAGPVSVLMTNETGYSTTITFSEATNKPVTGQLLGQGDYLIFSQAKSDRLFVWNVREHRGFVCSEALQGYAWMNTTSRVVDMSITSQPKNSATQNVNGHQASQVEVAVTSATSTGRLTNNFKLWCADKLKDFPVRLESSSGDKRYVINLANFRQENIPSSLFRPPEDFTRYESIGEMNEALASRKERSKIVVDIKQPDVMPMPTPSLVH